VRAALDWSALHDAPREIALIGASYRLFGILNEQAELTRRSNAAAARLPAGLPAAIEGRYWVSRAQLHGGRDHPAMHEFAARAEVLFRSCASRPGLYWALCCRLWSGHVPADEAARLADEARALEPGLPHRLLGLGRLGLAKGHWDARRYVEGARDIDLALAHARAADASRLEVLSIGMRAMTHYALGEIEAGVGLLRPCVAAQRARNGWVAHPLGFLAAGLVLQGNRAEARERLAEFFRLSRADDWWLFNLNDEAYVLLAFQEGRLRSAGRLLGYSDHKTRQVTAIRMAEARIAQARAALDASLGNAALRRLLAEGAALDEDQVCALTLEATDSPPLASPT
jgi:hypothetical protein